MGEITVGEEEVGRVGGEGGVGGADPVEGKEAEGVQAGLKEGADRASTERTHKELNRGATAATLGIVLNEDGACDAVGGGAAGEGGVVGGAKGGGRGLNEGVQAMPAASKKGQCQSQGQFGLQQGTMPWQGRSF